MPWTPETAIGSARRLSEVSGRTPGTCHDTIDAVLVQASALLRRRSSEDMATVAAIITNAPHCVPCIALLTRLDARRIYAALEHLKSTAHARLIAAECRQCHRATTVHLIGE